VENCCRSWKIILRLLELCAIDGDVILTGSLEKTMKVWSKSSGELLQTLFGRHWANSVAVDDDVITSSDFPGSTIQWSLQTGKRQKILAAVTPKVP